MEENIELDPSKIRKKLLQQTAELYATAMARSRSDSAKAKAMRREPAMAMALHTQIETQNTSLKLILLQSKPRFQYLPEYRTTVHSGYKSDTPKGFHKP
ncbi:MAG: hypothetical protein U0T81_00320 [Saprospiraceae bacterium]